MWAGSGSYTAARLTWFWGLELGSDPVNDTETGSGSVAAKKTTTQWLIQVQHPGSLEIMLSLRCMWCNLVCNISFLLQSAKDWSNMLNIYECTVWILMYFCLHHFRIIVTQAKEIWAEKWSHHCVFQPWVASAQLTPTTFTDTLKELVRSLKLVSKERHHLLLLLKLVAVSAQICISTFLINSSRFLQPDKMIHGVSCRTLSLVQKLDFLSVPEANQFQHRANIEVLEARERLVLRVV